MITGWKQGSFVKDLAGMKDIAFCRVIFRPFKKIVSGNLEHASFLERKGFFLLVLNYYTLVLKYVRTHIVPSKKTSSYFLLSTVYKKSIYLSLIHI